MNLPYGAIGVLQRPLTTESYDTQLQVAASAFDLPGAKPQPMLNYWDDPSNLTMFKNHLLRITSQTTTNCLQSYRSTFSWPQIAAGPTGNEQQSICEFTTNGRSTVYLAYIDDQDHVRLSRSFDGQSWYDIDPKITQTVSSVEIFAFGWDLWLGFVTKDGGAALAVCSADGVDWTADLQTVSASAAATISKLSFIPAIQLEIVMICVIATDGTRQIFEFDDTNVWTENTKSMANGLPATVSDLVFCPFYSSVACIASDTAGAMTSYIVGALGQPWTPNVAFPITSTTDNRAALRFENNEWVVYFCDKLDGYLKMLRSGTNPIAESLYVPTSGGISAARWQGRVLLAVHTSLAPGLVNVMQSDGIGIGQNIAPVATVDVTAMLPAGQLMSLTSYLPENGNPTLGRLYAMMFDDATDSYAIYVRDTANEPAQDSWKNLRGPDTPLPNPNQGFHLTGSFGVALDGTIFLSAAKVGSAAEVIWRLPTNKTVYETFGGPHQDLVINPKTDRVVSAYTDGGLYSRPVDGTSDWVRIDKAGPGGSTLNLLITDQALYFDQPGVTVSAGPNAGDINQYTTVEVPFRKICATPQGDIYAIHNDADEEGLVFWYDQTNSIWQPVGISAVDLASDQYGQIYVVTDQGQIVLITPDTTTQTTRFTVHSLGNTHLHYIRGLQVDFHNTIWVQSEGDQLYRSFGNAPIVSDPYIDVGLQGTELVLAYRRNDDVVVARSQDGSNWYDETALGVVATMGPSLAQTGSQLTVAYVSPDPDEKDVLNSVYLLQQTPTNDWPQGPGINAGFNTITAPSLRQTGEDLRLVTDQTGGTLTLSDVTGVGVTPTLPTLANGPARLHYVSDGSLTLITYEDENGAIKLTSSTDQKTWVEIQLPANTTGHSPSMAQVGQTLFLCYLNDPQGNINLLKLTEEKTWETVPMKKPQSASPGCVIQAFKGQGDTAEKLYLFFVDATGNLRTRKIH